MVLRLGIHMAGIDGVNADQEVPTGCADAMFCVIKWLDVAFEDTPFKCGPTLAITSRHGSGNITLWGVSQI